MNYNKHLEELGKYREIIYKLESDMNGLGIELSNYIKEVDEMAQDYEKKSTMNIPADGGFDRKPEKKKYDKDGNIIVRESVINRMQVIAGIKNG